MKARADRGGCTRAAPEPQTAWSGRPCWWGWERFRKKSDTERSCIKMNPEPRNAHKDRLGWPTVGVGVFEGDDSERNKTEGSGIKPARRTYTRSAERDKASLDRQKAGVAASE